MPVSVGMSRLGTALPTCGTALAAAADMTSSVQRTYSGSVHAAAMSHCVAARCFEHATDHGDRLALSVAGLQVSFAELATVAAPIGVWLESAAERPPPRGGITAAPRPAPP